MLIQVLADAREPRVVPYGTDDAPSSRFWNLKADPNRIVNVERAAGVPELLRFLRFVNGLESRFASVASDVWTRELGDSSAPRHEAGARIDLAFDRVEVAQAHAHYGPIATLLEHHAMFLRAQESDSDATLVQLQMQPLVLRERGFAVWMTSAWIFGRGADESSAIEHRTRGFLALETVLRLLSRELTSQHGERGTPLLA